MIIGAIWLAWQGLIRKRATRTIEGTIWMVIACAAAIWLIGQPQDFTDVGTTVSNGVTSVLNTAFANLPASTTGVGSNCLPIQQKDPDSVTANFAFTSGSGLVDENANELWSVLVCKPWLVGEFGTSEYADPNSAAADTNVVNEFGRSLLFAQAVATNETDSPAMIQEKQAVYNGIALRLQTQDPAVYSLFQGNQWTTRLEIAFTALFAAIAAGLLVLLIALTLIILKLGFLLLLVAGPFFLIVGVHPGFGRVVAIRWFEMLVGVLLKQVAVALVLSVLLYCYSLIMSTTDQELPWALKIMMISLVTVAVFIYRKPFQHLFSSVGYGMLGANERAETSWRESAFGFRRVSATAAGTVMPGAGAVARVPVGAPDRSRAAGRRRDRGRRRPRRRPRDLLGRDDSGVPTADSHSAARQWPGAGVGTGRTAPPLPLPTNGAAPTAERRLGGLGQGRGRGGGGSRGPASRRSARPGRCPPRPRRRRDRRRPPRPRPTEAARGDADRSDADDVDAAGADPVHAAARTAVLVAVPPSAPVAEPAMELSPGRQRLLFVVVVIALIGLGIFVIQGRNHGNTAAPAASPTPSASGPNGSAAATGAPTAAPSAAASLAAGSPSASAGGANIYQWLPFTQSDLAAAAKTTRRVRQRLRQHELHRDEGRLRREAGRAHHPAGGGDAGERLRDVRDQHHQERRTSRSPPGPRRSTRSARSARSRRSHRALRRSRSRSPSPRNSPRPRARLRSTPEYTITTVSTATGWQVQNIQLASLGNQ